MEKKHTPNSLMFFIILITYAVGLVMLIVYWGSAASLFKLVYGALEPFFVGMIIAYILNLPMRFLETKAFPFLLKGKKINPKLSRIVALLMSFLFVSMIIAAVIAILIPQISVSITTLISNFEGYLPKFYAFVENTLAFFHIDLTFF